MSGRGAIVLCGGQSRRMGRAKALLPFGTETLLQRVVGRLRQNVAPETTVVVAAAGQPLPELPAAVQVARDRQQDCGPLAGLATGMYTLPAGVEAVYATSCDVPLLVPAFVERLFELLADHDVAVPRDERWYHPLAAVYRRSVLPQIEALLKEGEHRPRALFGRVDTFDVATQALRDVDPELATLVNVNSPADYLAALERAGLPKPSESWP